MQRAAAILLVVYSSFMLGKAPCCRIHDFTGSVPAQAVEPAVEGDEARGPGQYVCPCCEKPVKHDDGQPVRQFGKPRTCPPLIASIAGDSDGIDLPLALPCADTFGLFTIEASSTVAFVNQTRAPPAVLGALSLPLLL